jgi:hypothetical protein
MLCVPEADPVPFAQAPASTASKATRATIGSWVIISLQLQCDFGRSVGWPRCLSCWFQSLKLVYLG